MKRTILNAGLLSMGVLILSSFTTSSRPGDLTATKEQKRRIKMVKIVDGQKAELDTVVADNKPFVWQGDTLNAPDWEMDFRPMPEDFEEMADEMMFMSEGPKHLKWNDKGGDHFMFFDEDKTEGDSTYRHMMVKRFKGNGGDEDVFVFRGPKMKNMPGVPPVPPVPSVPHVKMIHKGNVIDLNSPNVISFKKKDLGGGREKIEIIRKKSDRANEDMNVNFNFDSADFPIPSGIPHMRRIERQVHKDLHHPDDKSSKKIEEESEVKDEN